MRPPDLTVSSGRCNQGICVLHKRSIPGPASYRPLFLPGGDARRRCLSEQFHGFASKIDMLDRFPVFDFQVANNVADARADLMFEFRFVDCGRFSPEQLVGFRAGRPSAVMIDDGIPQDAIEPCRNALPSRSWEPCSK